VKVEHRDILKQKHFGLMEYRGEIRTFVLSLWMLACFVINWQLFGC